MTDLTERIEPFLDEHAPALVAAYFAVGDSGPAFTGSQFELLAIDGNDPNRITPADLVAITMLSVSVPASTAIWLLGPGLGPIQALLRRIPTDVNLWSELADVGEDGAASHLWSLLEEQPGIGWVIAGKLCARKRPRLLPVYDDVVRSALGSPPKFWASLQRALQDRPDLVARLGDIHTEAEVPSEVPLLRVLDIAIWMRNHGKASSTSAAVRAIPSIDH